MMQKNMAVEQCRSQRQIWALSYIRTLDLFRIKNFMQYKLSLILTIVSESTEKYMSVR